MEILKGKYKAEHIANWLVTVGIFNESFFTNMQIQKLLYFAQGIFYKTYKQRLIAEDFEAWQYGPVIKKMYDKYKIYGRNPIIGPEAVIIKDYDAMIEESDIKFLKTFYTNFASVTPARYLVSMSHTKGKSWDKMFNNPLYGNKHKIDFKLVCQDFE